MPGRLKDRPYLRAYGGGVAASASLIGAVVLAFLVLSAYVAIDRSPPKQASERERVSRVIAAAPPSNGPAGQHSRAETPGPGAGAGNGSQRSGQEDPSEDAPPPPGAESGPPAEVVGPDGGGDPSPPPPIDPPPVDPPVEPPPPPEPLPPHDDTIPANGIAGGAVKTIEDVTDTVIDLPLASSTAALTDPVDEATTKTLNQVGALAGNPALGNQVAEGASGLGAVLGN